MKGETWYAYLAGLFDGEGSLHISFHLGRAYGKEYLDVKPVVQLSFAYSEEKEKLLKELYNEFGGSFGVGDRNDKGKLRKVVWWRLSELESVEKFLKSTLPYLRIKKKSAELMLKAIEIMKLHHHSSAPRSLEFFLELAKISDELSSLGRYRGNRKWTYKKVKKFLEEHQDIYVNPKRKCVTREIVAQILELRKQGLSYGKIAKKLGISKSTVARVIQVAEGRYDGKAINIKAYLHELQPQDGTETILDLEVYP
ncbi:MAG: hypothetical protein DRO40_07835 [Thermoprotei archaeon]|nr:MAG: hypothetical protein DRO40_07835 [Thermoprotei archaeon]